MPQWHEVVSLALLLFQRQRHLANARLSEQLQLARHKEARRNLAVH